MIFFCFSFSDHLDVCGHVGIGVMARLSPLGMGVHHVSLGIEQWSLIIFPRETGGMCTIATVRDQRSFKMTGK